MDSATYSNWHSGFYQHILLDKSHPNTNPEIKQSKMKEKRPIKVYIRVRPFNEDEKERSEASALEIYKEESRIKVLDERHSLETSYFFDGVFGEDDDNKRVYSITAKPLIGKLLNGINCALLTYGQTGTGKTHTVLAEGSVTNYTIDYLFDRINQDVAHMYKITCSFVQVYQDKVYDLLNPDCKDELFVREHPKKGIYVANLSHHSVRSAEHALEMLNQGRKELIIAETRMVRQSSRSHAIFQVCIERRLDPRGCKMRSASIFKDEEPLNSSQSDMNASCDYEDGEMSAMMLEEDIILRGKIDICDLAGSERLGKTMAEGVRLSEAKHINSSLLELGNVIYALSEGTRRHIPFRNSTLTRLLQECLGPQCRTSFIVCVAPTASEAYETRCSLNFGTRARKITNKERLILNVEVDYKILAKRLARRIECLEQQLDQSGIPNSILMNKTETDAPISVETQTELALAELQSLQHLTNKDTAARASKFTQLEMLIISEIMTAIYNSSKDSSASDKRDALYENASKLLHELMDAVSMQHENCSLTEDHWAEADLKQILKDTMDDLDLLKEAIVVDSDASFQANDVIKYTAYVCKQLNERCQAMEEDMNYCLEKFQGLVTFEEDDGLHRKMKKLLEFLDNNREGDIAELVNYEAVGFDIEFIAWLISVHMALRLALALLSLPGENVSAFEVNGEEIGNKQGDSKLEHLMNDTFESITSIDEDSTLDDFDQSYDNFNGYDCMSESVYAKASTPKRGHYMPLNIQNQLYGTGKERLAKFLPKESHFHQISSSRMNSRGGGFLEPNLWSAKGCLNVSLASDLSDFDSTDGAPGEMDITHEQRMKHRRLIDSNVTKLEEKCDLLEEKNSKLMRTLNVIMRENKDVNEKLRLMEVGKLKTAREIEDFDHKLRKLSTDKKAIEFSLKEARNELKKAEKEAKRFSLENKQTQIQNHGLQRQVSMKDGENESLRQQIAELKTELAASKADVEVSSKRLEELEEKSKEDNTRMKELTADKEEKLTELKALCGMLEKSLAGGDIDESRKAKGAEVGDEEGTFETELFVAIENNIRIEGIVNEAKARLLKLVDPENEQEDGSRKKKDGVVIVDPKDAANKPIKRRTPQKSRGGDTKTSALRRAKSLRNEAGRRPVVVNKANDAVVPRGAKIKELMNEKLKIEKSYKELLLKNEKVEEELKTTKSQVEMLVSECGVLDHELAKMKKNGTGETSSRTNSELDVTGVSSRYEDSLFLRTKDIDKLSEKQDELRRDLEDSQNRVNELETELAVSLDENLAVKRHAREVERKYEETKSEMQHYQGQNYSQKIENSRLRDHVIQLTQELSREQQRVEQLASKLGNTKERNASQVRRLEGEMLKCVKKLDRYRERERARRQEIKQMDNSGKDSSEADSGMVPDHSDESVHLK